MTEGKKEDPFGPDFHSVEALERHVRDGLSLQRATLTGLDLTRPEIDTLLRGQHFDDAVLLGCRLSPDLSSRVKETGGSLFSRFDDVPFDPYRSSLYSVGELMSGYVQGRPETLSETLDARIYRYFKARSSLGGRLPVVETLAYRIHDHAIDRAMDELLKPSGAAPRRVVGIMGGHKLRRDDPGFFNVAQIASRLTEEGLFVATGGGPGAMEAGNLGAWFAGCDREKLRAAVDLLVPSPWYLDKDYVDRAFGVLDARPSGEASLAVPTWFYGHEPSNLFSTSIAKYFANSIREDGLLAIATYGVIYSPGSAGTIQEVFQDAAQNHYATMGSISPMVFLGIDYWTTYRPVFQLLTSMANGKQYREFITITDDPDEAVRFILEHPPREP